MPGLHTTTVDMTTAFEKYKKLQLKQPVRVLPKFYRVHGEDANGYQWVYKNGYVTYAEALADTAGKNAWVSQDIEYIHI